MMTDPIADLLIQIKNSYSAHKSSIIIPHSNMKEALAKLLSKEGYLGTVSVLRDKKKQSIQIELIYEEKKPRLTQVIRISKPGKKVYVSKNKIPKVLSGLGTTIVSTPKGLMSYSQARKNGLGGELICKLW